MQYMYIIEILLPFVFYITMQLQGDTQIHSLQLLL